MTPTEQSASEFRGLDPDLPSIAALAAAEIDAVIRHERSQLEHVQQLATVLNDTFGEADQGRGKRCLLDPVSTTVFTKTFLDSHQTNLSSYEELARISAELAQQMRAIGGNDDENLLPTMKGFCLALSRYALASKGRIDNLTGTPSFQR